MIMTTMESQYWPQTAEGRLLCVLLAVYAFAIFGFVTATIASYFIDQGQQTPPAPEVAMQQTAGLRAEVAALRAQVGALTQQVRQLVQTREGQHQDG
jgi:voltage-gated potassium channel